MRPPGFLIKGTGFDDGNKFKVYSTYVEIDPADFLEDWSDAYFEKDGLAQEVAYRSF